MLLEPRSRAAQREDRTGPLRCARQSGPVVARAEFPRLPLGVLFREAVSLLNLPRELLGVTLELLQIVVRQLAPLLLDLALDLMPTAAHLVLVHDVLLYPILARLVRAAPLLPRVQQLPIAERAVAQHFRLELVCFVAHG